MSRLFRRLFALIVLLVISLVLRSVEQLPIPGASTALTLGILLLCAYIGGQIAKLLGLSRVTGYIAIGLILGPSGLLFLTDADVLTLQPFSSVAIALIAITAGGELSLERLRGAGKYLASITLVQSAVVMLLVFGTVLALSDFLPFTAGRDMAVVLTVAMVFASVAVASSPSVAIAVITDTESAGPVSTAILGVTVLKDVLVIILFAGALTIAYSVLEPGQAGESSIALNLAREIGGSIIVGGIFGAVIGGYLRWVNQHLVLFTIALAWILVEVAASLHLELLLMALTAGFALEAINPKEGDAFVHALEAASLPLYALFFSLAGAAVHLKELALVWQWALLLVAVRAIALWIGTVVGARLGSAPEAVGRHAWPAFISQAGVALGMATLVAREFPEWGAELQSFFVGLVAIHEIIGPIAAKWTLDRAGETGRAPRTNVSGLAH
jgi:Kef-type K+ transport system membrane component KefB